MKRLGTFILAGFTVLFLYVVAVLVRMDWHAFLTEGRAISTRQLQMFKIEYDEASFKRDMVAYAVVGGLESWIYWLKQDDAAHVLSKLEAAKAKYEKADAALRMLERKGEPATVSVAQNSARSA